MAFQNGLSRSEAEVLSVIYDSKEHLSLKEIMELVNSKYNHDWKPQTISTFLSRAIKKGYLVNYRKGRYFYYVAIIEPQITIKNEISKVAYLYFNGDINKVKEFINEKM